MQTERLIADLLDARARTLELVSGLSAEQLMGPHLEIVNPLRWEIGHVAYFYEFWILRHLDRRESLLANADALYDSIHIAHEDRWDLPLLSMDDTRRYMHDVLEAVTARLTQRSGLSEQDTYLTRYATFHEDMHTEAFTYSRQTLSYPEPQFHNAAPYGATADAGPLPGDVAVPGGRFLLGAGRADGFCFDNEKWAHPLEIKPFRIARAPVTNDEYQRFVKDRGYFAREFWCDPGWEWRTRAGLEHPVYWRADDTGAWQQRHFDRWQPLGPHRPVVHVGWYEANAFCRWAGRRLPSEAEWEVAAAGRSGPDGQGLSTTKSQYPWGDTPPTPDRANLDGYALDCIDVAALPAGDSAFGCRQMLGNVWEWTATTFGPYPDFSPDMYQDYSQPLFGVTRVLRGGSWATRGRLIRNTWRNYYGPERYDTFAGFRTCTI
ncbi:MAG: SUMF1/EgtB/PvdO family nonheme iron enzyme [Gammaproteobacteria bacterium]|nr:SUMF1/EgtB/PvdO family nonheme iron enzyme [Gammaproteobacteria bacterium]